MCMYLKKELACRTLKILLQLANKNINTRFLNEQETQKIFHTHRYRDIHRHTMIHEKLLNIISHQRIQIKIDMNWNSHILYRGA